MGGFMKQEIGEGEKGGGGEGGGGVREFMKQAFHAERL